MSVYVFGFSFFLICGVCWAIVMEKEGDWRYSIGLNCYRVTRIRNLVNICYTVFLNQEWFSIRGGRVNTVMVQSLGEAARGNGFCNLASSTKWSKMGPFLFCMHRVFSVHYKL